MPTRSDDLASRKRHASVKRIAVALLLALSLIAAWLILPPSHEVSPYEEAASAVKGDLKFIWELLMYRAESEQAQVVPKFSSREIPDWAEKAAAKIYGREGIDRLRRTALRPWSYRVTEAVEGKQLSEIRARETVIEVSGVYQFRGISLNGVLVGE
jgi:hypothetical protein